MEQAIALNHHNADFHAFSGQLWARQGNFEQAIAAWKQAQRLEPHHAVSHYLAQLEENAQLRI